MTKAKVDDPQKAEDNLADEKSLGVSKSVKSIKSSRQPSDKKHNQGSKRRKVKFAEPIIHLRLYDRTASPNAETEQVVNPKINPTALDELQPPLSLVAHLDLAAKKLNARDQHAQKTNRNAAAQRSKQTTVDTTATIDTAASKTQFPARDQIDLIKDAPATDTKAVKSGKTAVKTSIKPDVKNDNKDDNKKTKGS